jgi:hypothetical protein
MKSGFISMAVGLFWLLCGPCLAENNSSKPNPRNNPLVRIETVSCPESRGNVEVPVYWDTREYDMLGFEYEFEFDETFGTLVEVTPGILVIDCQWEYFYYRIGPYGILVQAIADIANGPYHPSCYGPPDTEPHELAKMKFNLNEDYRAGSFAYVRFSWHECDVNSITSFNGDTLLLDRRVYDHQGNLIWDEEDNQQFPEEERILFVGAPDSCLNLIPDMQTARFLDFQNGGIRFYTRGDANGDGIVNVSDAVAIINYVFVGGDPPDPIEAGDCNCDDVVNVSDAVWIINYVFVGGNTPCDIDGDGIPDC